MMQSQDLQESIKASRANTRTYFNDNIEFNRPEFGKKTLVTVTNHRTLEAAGLIHEKNPDKRIGVLNFASATNPGGGVVWGSSAQEESLCRCSTLYPVLNQKSLLVNYYDFHRSRQNSLYTDRCIYTPSVKVIKSDTDYPERLDSNRFFDVDVITCAAPNLRHAEPISDAELERLHLQRGRRILDVAVENKIDCLVLGAFGCGAFRNNPQVVAKVYAKLMEEFKGAFDLVEFAVFYWGNEITNYKAFKDALG
jgi:uncharacterized protein (TIGR02452 family)